MPACIRIVFILCFCSLSLLQAAHVANKVVYIKQVVLGDRIQATTIDQNCAVSTTLCHLITVPHGPNVYVCKTAFHTPVSWRLGQKYIDY